MTQSVFTLQRWNEYSQEETKSFICIKNAALTPSLVSYKDTSVIFLVNGERLVLCTLKPYSVENKSLDFIIEKGSSVAMFLEGENDVDMLLEEKDTISYPEKDMETVTT